MKRLRWLIPIILGVVTFAGLQITGTAWQQKTSPIPLTYNHVANQPIGATQKEKYFFVTPQALDKQINYLQAHRFVIGANNNDKQVNLIFTGAYSDFPNAYKVLQMHNVPATIYADPKTIDAPNFLTQKEINELKKDPNLTIIEESFASSPVATNKKEVSGTIGLAQFADLLGNQEVAGQTRQILVALAVVLISLAAIYKIDLAIFLVLLALPTFWTKLTILGIPTNLLEVMVGTLFLTVLIVKPKKLKIKIPTPYLLALVLIAIGFVINLIITPNKLDGLGYLKSFLIVPILFGWVVATRRMWSIIYFTTGLVIANTIVSVVALCLYNQGYFYVNFDASHLATFFGNPNYLASFVQYGLIVAIVSVAFAIRQRFAYPMLLIHIPILIAGATILRLTDSQGAILAIIMTTFYVIWNLLSSHIQRACVLTILIISIGLTLFLYNQPGYRVATTSTVLNNNQSSSVTSRYFIWKTALNLIAANPLGIGLANFGPEFAKNVSKDSPEQGVDFAHNTYLDWATQLGLIGLIGFALFLGYFGYLTRIWQVTSDPDVLTIRALMIVFMLHSLVDSQYFKNDYALIFALMIALSILLTKKSNKKLPNRDDF